MRMFQCKWCLYKAQQSMFQRRHETCSARTAALARKTLKLHEKQMEEYLLGFEEEAAAESGVQVDEALRTSFQAKVQNYMQSVNPWFGIRLGVEKPGPSDPMAVDTMLGTVVASRVNQNKSISIMRMEDGTEVRRHCSKLLEVPFCYMSTHHNLHGEHLLPTSTRPGSAGRATGSSATYLLYTPTRCDDT